MGLGQICCTSKRTACHHGEPTDYGYGGMDNGTKVSHSLQGIKSSELEAVVYVVNAQPERYGTDFDAVASYLGQIVTKEGLIMQSVQIANTGSKPVRPRVAAFMRKVECKKYPKAVWNSKQQSIKPATM